MNILLVCTGNTCRSPMAEGILKKLASGDRRFHILSGGLFAMEGEPASTNAVQALSEMGIDISAHTAKNVHEQVIRDADLILTMTQAHKDMLIARFGREAAQKTDTLMSYAGMGTDVADPFGAGIDVYRQCAKTLEAALTAAFDKMRRSLHDI